MRAPSFLLVASACGLLALGACKEDPKRPPVSEGGSYTPGNVSGGGGGTDGGQQTDGGGDEGPCTDLENSTDVVQQNAILDVVPAGSGGQITDGTYFLTEARHYIELGAGQPGLTNTYYQGALRITNGGTTIERVMAMSLDNTGDGGASSSSEVRGTITPSGTNATITLSCPTAATEPVSYSALSNSLTLSNLTTKESFVYTKQQ